MIYAQGGAPAAGGYRVALVLRPVARSGRGQPRCPLKVDSRPAGGAGVCPPPPLQGLTPSRWTSLQLAHPPVALRLKNWLQGERRG